MGGIGLIDHEEFDNEKDARDSIINKNTDTCLYNKDTNDFVWLNENHSENWVSIRMQKDEFVRQYIDKKFKSKNNISYPTEKEIKDASKYFYTVESEYVQAISDHYFQKGAQWVIEQIQNKNKPL